MKVLRYPATISTLDALTHEDHTLPKKENIFVGMQMGNHSLFKISLKVHPLCFFPQILPFM